MGCECQSEEETADKVAAGIVSGDAVIQYLICALDLLDKRQKMADVNIDEKAFLNLRACREKLKATIKFIEARA